MAPPRAPATSLLLLLLTILAAAASAQQLALSRPEGDCLAPALTSLTSSYNFFPSTYQLQSIQAANPGASSTGLETKVEFASDFSVTYYGTYKIVNNSRAGELYLLYQCGTPNPQTANTELDLPPGTKVFEVPLVSVAVTDSNAAAFLGELGLIDRVAFASKYSVNPCLQAINVCGGNAVSASNDNSSEWQELAATQQSQVDAIFTGDKTANPKSIAVTAYADPGVLNRAEWVKFVAVFFNKEVEANRLFSTISTDYNRLKAAATEAAAAATGPAANRVAWISKFGDTLTMSYAVYKQQLVTDAGGVMPAPADVVAAGGVASTIGSNTNYNFNASVPAQRTGFFDLLQDVDIIFDESYTPESANLLDMAAFTAAYGPESATLPAVDAGKVYAFNNKLGKSSDDTVSTDWFESASARPDLVLADFVRVITPSAALEGQNSLAWLRQLPAGVTASNGLTFSTAAACDSINTAANAVGRCDRAEPARICPNAYRDCATGELKTVTDPTQRCTARTTCPEPTPTPRPQATSAASAAAPGFILKLASGCMALAAALLML